MSGKDKNIQVGVMALRSPTGEFLETVPIYKPATPERKAAQEEVIEDIAAILAEGMKTYLEGRRKIGRDVQAMERSEQIVTRETRTTESTEHAQSEDVVSDPQISEQ